MMKSARRQSLRHRRATFEALESRQLLAVTLDPIAAMTGLTSGVGIPIGLNGETDGTSITYSVTSSNANVTASILNDGGRSLKLDVENYGTMLFHLFEQDMPRTTARIVQLVQQGFYTNVPFHRIIKDFMIQGGDPTGTGSGGSNTSIDDEFNINYRFTAPGLLAMAKSLNDTADSQFFVTSAATRWLDFHHSIFGVITEGDSVREAIENVAVDSNDKPTSTVKIASASIVDDLENGVLVLKAASGVSEADITVTATDSTGASTSRTFHASFVADTTQDAPFLAIMEPIVIAAGQSYTMRIPAYDANSGDYIYYGGRTGDANKLGVSVGLTSGQLTITPKPGVAGVSSVTVFVSSNYNNISNPQYGYDVDSQTVPVYIKPAKPTVQLLSSHDTGASNSDLITNRNNSTGKALRFRISDVVDGAELKLYDGVQLIGSIVVPTGSNGSVEMETTASYVLTDGPHEFTAVQILKNQAVNVGNYHTTVDLGSDASAAVVVTVDTSAPQITSTAVTQAKEYLAYSYTPQSNGTTADGATYSLVQAPAGMAIRNGSVVWTPSYGQKGTQAVQLRVSDKAGNTSDQTFQIAVAEGEGRREVIGNSADAHATGWTWTEADGDYVRPIFAGPGYAELIIDGQNTLRAVMLHGTTKGTTLAFMVTRGGASDGMLDINRLTADSSVGNLALANVNLVGTGLDVTGSVGLLMLNNVATGADLHLAGQSTDKLVLVAKAIGDVDLTYGGTLTTAVVNSWAAGRIDVFDLGNLSARGTLGATVKIDSTKNAKGGFDSITVLGGNFTGSVDVPGAGGVVTTIRINGQGGDINAPNSIKTGGAIAAITAVGGDITANITVGGKLGPIHAYSDGRGHGGHVNVTPASVAAAAQAFASTTDWRTTWPEIGYDVESRIANAQAEVTRLRGLREAMLETGIGS
jgi:cyclophilin family peptidyl-prolyl cis-trans isomerase